MDARRNTYPRVAAGFFVLVGLLVLATSPIQHAGRDSVVSARHPGSVASSDVLDPRGNPRSGAYGVQEG